MKIDNFHTNKKKKEEKNENCFDQKPNVKNVKNKVVKRILVTIINEDIRRKQNKIEREEKSLRHNFINFKNTNQTLIVGRCFCGETYLDKNEILSSGINTPDRKLKVLTRSPIVSILIMIMEKK